MLHRKSKRKRRSRASVSRNERNKGVIVVSIKTKFIDVDVQKIHDNINRRDAETISDIVYDALNELGYIDDDNLMSWSWNVEVSVEVKE